MKLYQFSVNLFFFLLIFGSNLFAQDINPGADNIYRPNVVAIIEISMLETDKTFLLADKNIDSEVYLNCNMRFENDVIDETITGIGIRLRGNTSRGHPKRSFKLKFKEFGGAKFNGYKKFNLKAENNDPSFLREHISLELFRKNNVPAARSHHAKLYINGEYMGLYLNVEQIDDEFAKKRFGNDTGNMYKCTWGASLETNNDVYNNNLFELETNEDVNDRSKLENFIQVLNKTPDSQFKTEIEKVLNVENALRFLAIEAILGQWDGYAYNKNNYYLYENTENGKMEFIPYDLDNTFGINWIPKDWATRDLTNWAIENEKRPLQNRLLDVPEYYNFYVSVLWKMIDDNFNEDYLFPVFDSYLELLKNPIKDDKYYPLTFDFSFDDFLNSHLKQVVSHCPYGLKPYVGKRVEKALEQLPIINSINSVTIENISLYPNPVIGESFVLKGYKGEIQLLEVYSLEGKKIDTYLIQKELSMFTFYEKPKSGMYFLKTENSIIPFLVN